MAFRHGKDTGMFLDSLRATPYLNSADFPRTLEVAETTTFGNDDKTYIAGRGDATVTMGGFYDGDVGQISPVLFAMADAMTVRQMTFCPDGGCVLGRVTRMADIILTEVTPSSPVASVTSLKANGQATGGSRQGRVLNDDTSRGTGTVTGTGVDNGAATSNGSVTHVHVTLNSRTTAIDVKVQHSTDNSVWVDLVQQTVPAGVTVDATHPFGQPTVYKLTSSGTVNRYVRALITPTAGSGSYIAVVALARF